MTEVDILEIQSGGRDTSTEKNEFVSLNSGKDALEAANGNIDV